MPAHKEYMAANPSYNPYETRHTIVSSFISAAIVAGAVSVLSLDTLFKNYWGAKRALKVDEQLADAQEHLARLDGE
jgi:hypothetical protein